MLLHSFVVGQAQTTLTLFPFKPFYLWNVHCPPKRPNWFPFPLRGTESLNRQAVRVIYFFWYTPFMQIAVSFHPLAYSSEGGNFIDCFRWLFVERCPGNGAFTLCLPPAFTDGGDSTVCWCAESAKVKNNNTYMQLCCVHTSLPESFIRGRRLPFLNAWRQMRKRRSIKGEDFVFLIIKEKGFCLFLLNLSRVITDNAHLRIATDSSSAFVIRGVGVV